jgi:hypothetical protein
MRLQRKFKKSLKHCTIWQNHFSIIVGSVTLLIERLPFWRNPRFYQYYLNLKAKPKRGWLKWVKIAYSSSLIAGLSFFINCFFYGQRCFTCSKRLAEALFS